MVEERKWELVKKVVESGVRGRCGGGGRQVFLQVGVCVCLLVKGV